MAGAARYSHALLPHSLLVSAALALVGCGGGDGDSGSASQPAAGNSSVTAPPSSNASAPVGGGSSTPTTPAPTTPAPTTPAPVTPAPTNPAPGANAAPRISGTAGTIATINARYTFAPSATDPDNDALGFSIQNKPSWATFNTSTGALTGTPTAADVKTYANIVITVSDGKASSSLPAFAIQVAAAPSGSAGGVTLSWNPPTQNDDGTALVNLAGYTIVYGSSQDALHQSIRIENAGLTSYVVDNLQPGTYYFGIRAFTAQGVQSTVSNLVSKAVL